MRGSRSGCSLLDPRKSTLSFEASNTAGPNSLAVCRSYMLKILRNRARIGSSFPLKTTWWLRYCNYVHNQRLQRKRIQSFCSLANLIQVKLAYHNRAWQSRCEIWSFDWAWFGAQVILALLVPKFWHQGFRALLWMHRSSSAECCCLCPQLRSRRPWDCTCDWMLHFLVFDGKYIGCSSCQRFWQAASTWRCHVNQFQLSTRAGTGCMH